MKIPMLYSRSATGAIQQWEIELNGNKFRTHAGQMGGAITTSEWTVCDGKNTGRTNQTTPAQQAEAEALAKWIKKKDKGYFEDIKSVDQQLFVEPMLAKKWEDYQDKIEFPVYSQPKLDGIRCVATPQGLFSRNGKPFVGVPHIYAAVQEIQKHYTGVILDGELYADKFSSDFNAICSIVKKSKPTKADMEFAAKNIQYHVYDHVDPNHKFEDRFRSLLRTLKHFPWCMKLVYTARVDNVQELDKLYEKYVEDGYEGQMVRVNAPYENKRSKFLLKRKEFQDAEFEIISVNEGIGNRAGVAGGMTLRDASGKIFNSNIKGDFGLLGQYLLDGSKLVGKMATVKYFNLTPDGIPRFPFVIRIRDYE